MRQIKNSKALPIIRRSNIRDFIRMMLMPLVLVFFVRAIIDKENLIIDTCLSIVLEYILSIISLNYYNFHEEYLEIYYPTRIGKWRLRRINYSDIKLVRYYGDFSYDPIIRIYTSDKKKGLHLPSNSVISYSFKKTRKTLQFIQTKGIPIEIKSESEKKKRILDK